RSWILFLNQILLGFGGLLMPFCLRAAISNHAVLAVDGVLFLIFTSFVYAAEVHSDDVSCGYDDVNGFFPAGFLGEFVFFGVVVAIFVRSWLDWACSQRLVSQVEQIVNVNGYAGNSIGSALGIKGYGLRVLLLNQESDRFGRLFMPFCLRVSFFLHAVFALFGISNFVYRNG